MGSWPEPVWKINLVVVAGGGSAWVKENVDSAWEVCTFVWIPRLLLGRGAHPLFGCVRPIRHLRLGVPKT